ncbi:MAG TPA: hypothetical protein VJJ47_01905 [Candidatus Paceibacterota bacterium]
MHTSTNRDKKKVERVWSAATWGMSVSGRFGAFVLESVLGKRPGREELSLPAGDLVVPVRRNLDLLIEIKASQTSEGAQVPIQQLRRGVDVVQESASYCGLVYAIYRYRNKALHPKTRVPSSQLARCKTLREKTRFLFGAAVEIVFIDAELLLELANRDGDEKGFYRKLTSVPGQTKGPVLELKSKFFSSLSGGNGEWTPHALQLRDRGWLQTRGVSVLRYDDKLREAFPSSGKAAEEVPPLELCVDRTVPLVGILSAETAAALASGHRCPLRKRFGISFQKLAPRQRFVATDLAPF